VPALLIAITTMRDCCADTVPIVEVLGIVTEIAEGTAIVVTVPLVRGDALKSSIVGFRVIVNALAATEAVIG
jgi:hypothetical protein